MGEPFLEGGSFKMKQLLVIAMASLAGAATSNTYKTTAARFASGVGAGSGSGSGTPAEGAGSGSGSPNEGAGGGSGSPAASGGEPTPTTNEGSDDVAFLRKQVSEANREAQTLRARAVAAEAKVKEGEDAKKSDLERAQADAQAAKDEAAKANAEARTARIETAAARMGFADPKDAARLIDDEAAGPKGENADKALADLLKAKPYLKAAAAGTLPQGGGKPAGGAGGAGEPDKQAEVASKFRFLKGRIAQREAMGSNNK